MLDIITYVCCGPAYVGAARLRFAGCGGTAFIPGRPCKTCIFIVYPPVALNDDKYHRSRCVFIGNIVEICLTCDLCHIHMAIAVCILIFIFCMTQQTGFHFGGRLLFI